jgi:hypothetical protein
MELHDQFGAPHEGNDGDGSDGECNDGERDDGDAVDHLWNAAHEMLRAMRSLLDAADEFVESQRDARPRSTGEPEPREGRVHHIDIDVRSEPGVPIDADADAS